MSYKVSFIGSGNVAWHLSQALENAGHTVQEVYSRKVKNAAALAAKLYRAQATDSLEFSDSKASIFILSVSDDAIQQIAETIVLPAHAVLCHTSGSQPLEILANYPKTGVWYPLQTFSKSQKLDVQRIPFFIEASETSTEEILVALAQSISKTVYLATSGERRILHIGGVFACNFTNHLWAIAKRIVEAENLEFELLKPLIEETFRKAMLAEDPAAVQTGPAIRNDQRILQSHLDYLQLKPDWQQLYKQASDSIRLMKTSL
jgi:predicted short-subunit dehydrogenase-like oxidoreductase (DUF2520 family)